MCTSQQPRPVDDVWGDSSEDEQGAAHPQSELEREHNARQQQHYNAGYRDGLDAGKERTLQQGFNIGFKEGAAAGYQWGDIKGAVKTLDILCGQMSGNSPWRTQVTALSQQVNSIKDRDAMLGTMKQFLAQPVKVPEAAIEEVQDAEVAEALRLVAQQPASGSLDADAALLARLPDMQHQIQIATTSLQQCMAITKLYQASAIRVLGTHAQAIASTRTHHSAPPYERNTPAPTEAFTQATTTSEHSSATAVVTSAGPAETSNDMTTFQYITTLINPQEIKHSPTAQLVGTQNTTDKPPVSTQCAAVVEAALWQDEIRCMQAKRDQLSMELTQLTTQLQERWAGQLAVLGPSTFYSPGAEFCPITSLISCNADVAALKANLKREIRAQSRQLSLVYPQMAASAMAAVVAPTAAVAADASMDANAQRTNDTDTLSNTAVLHSHPLAEDSQKVVRHLQSHWQNLVMEVTHLMVRLAQLRQLPAQPKKRITVAFVTEQVIAEMYTRQAHLQRYTQQL